MGAWKVTLQNIGGERKLATQTLYVSNAVLTDGR